jgi:hypothetical protein
MISKKRNSKCEFIKEGDIIAYNNPYILSVVCFGEYSFNGGEYTDSGEGFYFKRYEKGKEISMDDDIYFHPDNGDYVIGNIETNPDILKKFIKNHRREFIDDFNT